MIELMVGVVIGLLAILVIAQVALVYEGQKRSTTSGSDAQVNGALAVQSIQRDVQMSGYGLTSGLSAVGGTACAIGATIGGAASPNAPPLLAPVIIDDGAGGAPDALRVLGSGSGSFSVPIAIGSDHAAAETWFNLQPNVNVGNRQGDLMLAISAVSPPGCTLFNINVDGMRPLNPDGSEGVALGSIDVGTPLIEFASAAAPAGAVVVGKRLGHAQAATKAPWNGATPVIPDGHAVDTSYLINLGSPDRFIDHTYRIGANGLTVTILNASTGAAVTQELYSNIVTLQAVYGKALGADPTQADTWNADDPAADAGGTGWARIVAVRFAVVARSQQYEKLVVTEQLPKWRPDGVTLTDLKVDANPDWQHYRYKVYETVVPLRNMLLQS